MVFQIPIPFPNFWHEANHQAQDVYGRQVLLPGDFKVVNNCPIHKNNAERILQQYFSPRTCSMDFYQCIHRILIL